MTLDAVIYSMVLVSLGLAAGCNHCEPLQTGHRQTSQRMAPVPSGTTSTTIAMDASGAPSPEKELEPHISSIAEGANPVEGAAGGGACHVLAIGDSLTDPRSNGGGYLKAWKAHCPDCRFTNIGRGGFMVNQMLSLLRQHLLESEARYSHWVVFGGVNDLYSDLTAHRTVNKIERDLETIYGLGRQRGSVIIGITVAPWADFHRFYSEERGQNTVKLNEWITREQRTGLVDFVINSGSVLACGTSLHLCPEVMAPYRDGLHFGPEGHRRLGQLLVSTLGSAACGSAAQRQPSATR